MRVFHLGNTTYANQLNGEGARLFGGRWNQAGTACIYTSSSRALAVLEYLANVNFDECPSDLSLTEYDVPEDICVIISKKELPAQWNEIPANSASKIFGSSILADTKTSCFAVPSVIISNELNIILNPKGAAFNKIKIVSIEPFKFDQRIKKDN